MEVQVLFPTLVLLVVGTVIARATLKENKLANRASQRPWLIFENVSKSGDDREVSIVLKNYGPGTAVITGMNVLVDRTPLLPYQPPVWEEIRAPAMAEEWAPILSRVGVTGAKYSTTSLGNRNRPLPPGGLIPFVRIWGTSDRNYWNAPDDKLTIIAADHFSQILQARLVIVVHYESVFGETMEPELFGTFMEGVPQFDVPDYTDPSSDEYRHLRTLT